MYYLNCFQAGSSLLYLYWPLAPGQTYNLFSLTPLNPLIYNPFGLGIVSFFYSHELLAGSCTQKMDPHWREWKFVLLYWRRKNWYFSNQLYFPAFSYCTFLFCTKTSCKLKITFTVTEQGKFTLKVWSDKYEWDSCSPTISYSSLIRVLVRSLGRFGWFDWLSDVILIFSYSSTRGQV